MANRELNIHAVQFHPEATQTEFGETILRNFILDICGCKPDWDATDVVDDIRANAEAQVQGGTVSLPFSGGVDSTVSALILSEVFGDRLFGYTIDADQLRLDEAVEIENHARLARLPWKLIDARKEFVAAVSQSIQGPVKRDIFGFHYNEHINQQVLAIDGKDVVQGTLAPDLIESGETGGHKIVRHHNTGLKLPPGVRLLEPLKTLFKHEVREIGQALGLPESAYNRQPFPGPGGLIRVVGIPVSHDLLELWRWMDHTVTVILKSRGIYSEISQLVVAYLHLVTSGVKGDAADHSGSAGVRPFKTTDFMTGEGYYLPAEVMKEIDAALTKNKLILSTFFKYTPKPPARTEFE